jgi:abequosyltransferase
MALLLTIAIPTYNRASHLDFLLRVLAAESCESLARVRVLVSDNASTDDTLMVAERHRAAIPSLEIRRNADNLGADRNILACFDAARTPHVWIIGDDDVPLPGAIAQLLSMLESDSPDLVYLPSRGSRDVALDYPTQAPAVASWRTLSRQQFASVINVQFTFISGLVFRKEAASAASIQAAIRQTEKTNLIQLAWTYEILKQAQRFRIGRSDMLMATAGNSGGYAVLNVFLVNHTQIVTRLLGSDPRLVRSILSRTSATYLPGLLWNIRTNRMGKFELPAPETLAVPSELTRFASYRFLVMPVWQLPRAGAWLFFQFSRVVGRAARLFDRYMVVH